MECLTRILSLALLLSLISHSTVAQQNPLGATRFPAGLSDTAAQVEDPERPSRHSSPSGGLLGSSTWNGLTTFARAQPLRCLGADQEVKYDIAVLGMMNMILSLPCLRCLTGAPFDTATSFRPG